MRWGQRGQYFLCHPILYPACRLMRLVPTQTPTANQMVFVNLQIVLVVLLKAPSYAGARTRHGANAQVGELSSTSGGSKADAADHLDSRRAGGTRAYQADAV